eukprot:scaffold275712_cov30-Tisochrysis_lutea.AAC.1
MALGGGNVEDVADGAGSKVLAEVGPLPPVLAEGDAVYDSRGGCSNMAAEEEVLLLQEGGLDPVSGTAMCLPVLMAEGDEGGPGVCVAVVGSPLLLFVLEMGDEDIAGGAGCNLVTGGPSLLLALVAVGAAGGTTLESAAKAVLLTLVLVAGVDEEVGGGAGIHPEVGASLRLLVFVTGDGDGAGGAGWNWAREATSLLLVSPEGGMAAVVGVMMGCEREGDAGAGVMVGCDTEGAGAARAAPQGRLKSAVGVS